MAGPSSFSYPWIFTAIHGRLIHRREVYYPRKVDSGFQCASCGEWNLTTVDESAGRRQSYVEDCQVCCKPNVLRVEYDVSAQEFFISAQLE